MHKTRNAAFDCSKLQKRDEKHCMKISKHNHQVYKINFIQLIEENNRKTESSKKKKQKNTDEKNSSLSVATCAQNNEDDDAKRKLNQNIRV